MRSGGTKRFAWLALLPLAAFAGVRDDYAQQWPLALASDDAGAYRVVLDRTVYAQLQSPTLQDLVVADAQGTAVAAALFDAEQPIARAAGSIRVPWFPLPVGAVPQAGDIASISEIAADGSLRRVILKETAPAAATAGSEYLLDTSRLGQPVQALQVSWAAGQAGFDLPYRVTASDDLKHWWTVQDEGHLVELRNNGERIVRDRIEIDRVQSKYLRLEPLRKDQAGLQVSEVRAEPVSAAMVQDWQWEELAGERAVGKDGKTYFQYQAQGRFPFERADVLLAGNSSNEWRLESRDGLEAEWQSASTPWMAFQLEGATATRSPPQALQQLSRHHYWRLQPTSGADTAIPTLRLGYRPEVVVFLAQGAPPYTLLAGSARGVRAEAPLAQLVDALRAQRGQAWQPESASLGKGAALAGEGALQPAPVKRDWKAWLLWALLIGGALVVAGFAFSLLKKPSSR